MNDIAAPASGEPRSVTPALALLLPLLFVLYPIFAVYNVNRSEIGIVQTVRPLLIGAPSALALTALLWIVARARDGRRAAVAASILLLAFFAQDVALVQIIDPLQHNIGLIPSSVLYLAWCLLWTGLPLWLLRTRRDISGAWPVAWIVGSVLLLPTLPPVAGSILAGLAPGQRKTMPETRTLQTPQPASSQTDPQTTPDLYVLVLDAYGRQDVLRTLYDLDNEPFLADLANQGFSVARASRANYIQTVLALEAMLNLNYLTHAESDQLNNGIANVWANTAARRLRSQGYRIVYVATGFPLSSAEFADEVREPEPPLVESFTPLERTLLDKTPFAPLMTRERVAFDKHRLKLAAALDAFADTATIPGPKFVVAHILAPHPPFVFGPQGESVYPKEGIFTIGDATDFARRSSWQEYRRGYAGQVRHLNTLVLQTLSRLRQNAQRPAVIVVLGDHGPRMQTDWRRLDRTNIHEAFYNLLAVSAPPRYRSTVTAATTGDTTPISVFRRLFTDIYGYSYPTIPNRSFYSSLDLPYRFIEVTDQVKGHAAENRP